jgi:hypothetical protein
MEHFTRTRVFSYSSLVYHSSSSFLAYGLNLGSGLCLTLTYDRTGLVRTRFNTPCLEIKGLKAESQILKEMSSKVHQCVLDLPFAVVKLNGNGRTQWHFVVHCKLFVVNKLNQIKYLPFVNKHFLIKYEISRVENGLILNHCSFSVI